MDDLVGLPKEKRIWKHDYGMPATLMGWTLEEVMSAANVMGYGPDYARFAAACGGGKG